MLRALNLFVAVLAFSCLLILTSCPSGLRAAGATRTFDGIRFQWCPPGTFAMGSPSTEIGHQSDETLHEVTLSTGFWLSTFEITQEQWENFAGTKPSASEGDDLPVESVSWNDVQEFLVVLNATTSGATYRLPTEAEWEYAYRADTTTRFYWGNDADETEIDDNAWYEDNSGGAIQPVGQKNANAWGFRDMGGNNQEWCQDVAAAYPAGTVTDPQGPSSGSERIVRGGAFSDSPNRCRAANRESILPDVRIDNIGFRLVRPDI